MFHRQLRNSLLAASIGLSTILGSSPGAQASAPPGLDREMLALLNSARQSAGLPALAPEPRLSQIAQIRADQVLKQASLQHTDNAGRLIFADLLGASGVSFSLAAENLAENNYPPNQTASAANAALLSSPSHAENILNRDFNAVGVAASGPGPDNRYYFAEIFAQLR